MDMDEVRPNSICFLPMLTMRNFSSLREHRWCGETEARSSQAEFTVRGAYYERSSVYLMFNSSKQLL
jgi:hypothetical protein